jgi:hypothetical protein
MPNILRIIHFDWNFACFWSQRAELLSLYLLPWRTLIDNRFSNILRIHFWAYEIQSWFSHFSFIILVLLLRACDNFIIFNINVLRLFNMSQWAQDWFCSVTFKHLRVSMMLICQRNKSCVYRHVLSVWIRLLWAKAFFSITLSSLHSFISIFSR